MEAFGRGARAKLASYDEVIGAYVTAGARIHLYRHLDRLGERVIYCDIQPKDEPKLVETGDKLGDMTSELRTTEYISEFVTGGPKNYAYWVNDTGTGGATIVCKARGSTLNYSSKQLVKFNVIRDMIIRSWEPTVMVHTEKKIKRKRKGGGTVAIVTEPEDKTYRISFFKRRRLADNSSVPFGYK